jgi:vacuolar protein sorting-associated protein 41
MDSIIAGLLSYPPNILVLSYTSVSPPSTPSSSELDFRRRTATRPELRIISTGQEELSSDALSLKNYARLQPGDYSLHWNDKLNCLYIVSPNDIVVGRNRTVEDRVQWLLDRGRYRDALEVFETQNQEVGKWTRKEIGVKYIEHLIEEG